MSVHIDVPEENATIQSDARFPRKFVGVHVGQQWLLGTPFATMEVGDLRRWATAFTDAADALVEEGR